MTSQSPQRSGRPSRKLTLVERLRRPLRGGTSLGDYYDQSDEERDAMAAAQEGRCIICGAPEGARYPFVIHNTGVVAGLHCTSCDHGLAQFRSQEPRLRAAAAFLEGDLAGSHWDRETYRPTRGTCPICEREGVLLETGFCSWRGPVVEGLHCQACDEGLEWFAGDPDRLRRAAEYVTGRLLARHLLTSRPGATAPSRL
jgi:hypothetical protein